VPLDLDWARDVAAYTARKREVLRRLALGDASKDIAESLGTSARTGRATRGRPAAQGCSRPGSTAACVSWHGSGRSAERGLPSRLRGWYQ